MTNDLIRQELIAKAEAFHARLPQYNFAASILVRVRKQIKTKLGIAFMKNEIAIAEPKLMTIPSFDRATGTMVDLKMISVYSVRNNCLTLIRPEQVEVL